MTARQCQQPPWYPQDQRPSWTLATPKATHSPEGCGARGAPHHRHRPRTLLTVSSVCDAPAVSQTRPNSKPSHAVQQPAIKHRRTGVFKGRQSPLHRGSRLRTAHDAS